MNAISESTYGRQLAEIGGKIKNDTRSHGCWYQLRNRGSLVTLHALRIGRIARRSWTSASGTGTGALPLRETNHELFEYVARTPRVAVSPVQERKPQKLRTRNRCLICCSSCAGQGCLERAPLLESRFVTQTLKLNPRLRLLLRKFWSHWRNAFHFIVKILSTGNGGCS
jgi:hypothetical protein